MLDDVPDDAANDAEGAVQLPLTVALSGPDNVGKTTQLRLLHRHCPEESRLLGPVSDYDPRWNHVPPGGLAEWWFSGSSREEFVDVLASSYLTRHRRVREQGPAAWLMDRGMPMLEATVAASFAVREQLDHNQAAKLARQLLRPYAAAIDAAEQDELGVLVLHTGDVASNVEASLARESESSEVYRRYQRCLAVHLDRLASQGRFAYAITVDGRAIMQVQDELRTLLGRHTSQWPERSRFTEATVVAFGGMSESGKSTAADWLHHAHGAARLKIGYLLDQAAARHSIRDVYALDETTQAELLVDALDRYLTAHHFTTLVTLESLHRHTATAALRALLGDRLVVIYLDASPSHRRRRSPRGPLDATGRDEIKQQRGAHRVRDLADEVINNDHTLVALHHRLDALVGDRGAPEPAVAPRRVGVDVLQLPPQIQQALDTFIVRLAERSAVDLIAVTGSGGRGKYQHGWSDVDVLVLAPIDALDEIALQTRQLTLAVQVKVGVTLATVAECRAGAVTPRLTHVLRQLATGQLGAQWCRDHLRLPSPGQDADAVASLADAQRAAMQLRRLLIQDEPELRSLYKVSALLAKVMLRSDKCDVASDDEALQTLATTTATVDRAADVRDARHDRSHADRLARAVLTTWLDTLPPTAGVEER